MGGQGGKGGHAGVIPVRAVAPEAWADRAAIGQGGGIYLGGGSLVLKGSAQIDHNKAAGGAGGKGGEGGSAFESTSDTNNFGPGGNGGDGGVGNNGYGGGMYVSSGTVTWTSGSLDNNSALGGASGLGGAAGFPKGGLARKQSRQFGREDLAAGSMAPARSRFPVADIEKNSAGTGGGIDNKGRSR